MNRADIDTRGCGRADCPRSGTVVEVAIPERGRRTLCPQHAQEAVKEHGARVVDESDAPVPVGGDA